MRNSKVDVIFHQIAVAPGFWKAKKLANTGALILQGGI